MLERDLESCCGNCPYCIDFVCRHGGILAYCHYNAPPATVSGLLRDTEKSSTVKWPLVDHNDVCGKHPDFWLPEEATP